MPLPSGDRSIPVKWSRRNVDGQVESVHGSLLIPENDPNGFRIYLGGTFPSEDTIARAFSTGTIDAEVYPVLHGESAEGSFTAVDSRVVGYNHRFGGAKLSDTTLRPRFLLMGSTKLREDELSVTRAIVKFWYQDEWADWMHLRISAATPETPEAMPGVEILPIDSKEAVIDGVTIRLEDASQRVIFPQRRITIEQQSRLVLEFPTPVLLPELISEWLVPLRFLLGAGLRREIGIDELWVYNEHWRDDETKEPIRNSLEVIWPNPREGKEESDKLRPLFKAAAFDWASELPSILRAIRQHHAVLDQWMDFVSRPPTPAMTEFTTLVQILENFDYELHPNPKADEALIGLAERIAAAVAEMPEGGEYSPTVQRAVLESVRPTLSHRLSEMDKEIGGFVSTSIGSKQWKTDLPAVRNAVIHGLPSAKFFARNIIPLQTGTNILKVLFEARLLLALGFKVEALEQLFRADPRWAGDLLHITSYLDSFREFAEFARSAT